MEFSAPNLFYVCFLGVKIACISCSFGVLGEHGGTMASCNFTSHGGIAPWVSPSIDPWDEESWICWSLIFSLGGLLGNLLFFTFCCVPFEAKARIGNASGP